MRYALYMMTLLLCFSSGVATAWQLAVNDGRVYASNNDKRTDMLVYLVWFDRDAKDNTGFWSWQAASNNWTPGVQAISADTFNLEPFENLPITTLPQDCEDEHRCFLALVATAADVEPLNIAQWQAVYMHPLSQAARQDRVVGQQYFATPDDVSRNGLAYTDDITTDPEAPAVAEETDSVTDGTDSSTETEKPDIFRLNGTQLLYGNNRAQRLQIIDVADPNQPTLTDNFKLDGYPQEIYTLGSTSILLQSNYTNSDTGTHLTVLQHQNDGTVKETQTVALDGQFLQSRRRNNVIYSVSQQQTYYWYDVVDTAEPMLEDVETIQSEESKIGLTIRAHRLEDGQLVEIKTQNMSGYYPQVAIFSDYLLLANRVPGDWRQSQIQVYDLRDDTNPLQDYATVTVPGWIPSEFHMNVYNNQLRVVYEESESGAGSTLAVFDLSNTDAEMLGKLDGIAKGEGLFATRFVDERAYIVTYERTDPLWVIDLADPTKPSILGELIVPGWSEKLFFYDDYLFAVGIHDQPEDDEDPEKSVRRVAVSLFDVRDPTEPRLVNRLIPLKETTYSYSEALYDERALLLDWQDAYAALPINTWETNAANHLQIISLANNQLSDIGRLDSPTYIRRSVEIADKTLAALGDESLLTLTWANGKPTLLAELELARNLSWIEGEGTQLWVGAISGQGYYRLLDYNLADLNQAQREVRLDQAFNNIVTDGKLALFYNYYNDYAVQAVNLSDFSVYPVHQLLPADSDDQSSRYYYSYQTLLHQGVVYQTEQRIYYPTNSDSEPLPTTDDVVSSDVDDVIKEGSTETEPSLWQPEITWMLHSWTGIDSEQVQAQPSRMIPGEPLGFVGDNQLLTRETTSDGLLRINLVVLLPNAAQLQNTRVINCPYYSGNMQLHQDYLMLNCQSSYYYYSSIDEDKQRDLLAQENQSVLLQIDTSSLATVGQWTLEGNQSLQAVADDTVMMYHYDYNLVTPVDSVAVEGDIATTEIAAPYTGPQCIVYRLTSSSTLEKVTTVDSCGYAQQMYLLPNQAVYAQGYAGLETVKW